MPSETQLVALNTQIAPAAVAAERATGLPAEITTAQCIFESGWLTRCPGNNCFGIKADAHGSGVDYVLTEEFLNGEWEKMPLAFESYNSLADCFVDHSRLITQGAPYAKAWAQYRIDKNWPRLILAIGPIYATAPGYRISICNEAGSYYVTSALQAARSAGA